RQLVTIRTDCDIDDVPNSWDSLVPGKVDTDTLVDLYNEFGFRTWLRELTDNPDAIPEQDARLQAPAEAAPEKVDYVTMIDWDTFNQWLRRIRAASLVALDTETTGLDPMQARLVGVSLSIEPGQACYIPVAHRGPDNPQQLPRDEVLDQLRGWLEDDQAAKALHNAKSDTHVFANEAIAL